ncbi:hypothetical protein [Nibricoccus sp. IMCC34717]|uniref:hypothetical protein n=1 Tax=Nibricoccus sp. IMCC34717 TaxID=3034021 RepID=UPI00384A778D
MPWLESRWNGESAYTATHDRWKAIVSLERGRLVHFGPLDSGANLLAAQPDRNHEEGLGGHRVWCGPQQEWAAIWPPAQSWENAGAARWATNGPTLELTMPPSPDGWPDVIREYRIEGNELVCGVRLLGGKRDAQVMQILQTPPETVVEMRWLTDAATGEALRILRFDTQPDFCGLPPHVTREGDRLSLRFRSLPIKLAFATQTIVARQSAGTLQLSKGADSGQVTRTPDDGLYTQLYLGAPKHGNVIELEQMSPAFAPDTGARAEMRLSLAP